MAINKVNYNGRTLIDLTEDTVTSETLLSGRTAHDRSGQAIIGSLSMDPIQSGLAIIVNGDTTSMAVPVGGYAYIKNNTHGLAEGLYKNTSSGAFPASGGTADGTVFTSVSRGGLNDLTLDGASAYGEVGPVPIASIQDALPLNAESLVVGIEPVQDLHGYDHPWPAGGGVNKLDASQYARTEDPTVTAQGVTFSKEGDDTFVVSISNYSGTLLRPAYIGFYTATIPYYDKTGYTLIRFVTSDSSSIIRNVRWASATSNNNIAVDLTLTAGMTATAKFKLVVYEGSTAPTSWTPYSNICPITGWTGAEVTVNEDVLDITFPTAAGTVYGGTRDVTTGLMTVTHGNIASYNGESLPGKWISSMDVYSAGGTPTTGAQVVYELATPITYQLTPQQVALLQGENNIWADCGDTSVGYWRDDSLSINRAITERAYDRQQGEALADDVGALSSAMTYVVNGNKSIESVTIPVGSYVRLVGSTIAGRSDGIYTVATAIPVNTVIDGTYFNESAPIPGGGLNAINNKLADIITIVPGTVPVNGGLATWDTSGINLQGKTLISVQVKYSGDNNWYLISQGSVGAVAMDINDNKPVVFIQNSQPDLFGQPCRALYI